MIFMAGFITGGVIMTIIMSALASSKIVELQEEVYKLKGGYYE
jgi:hypothetical protein